MRKFWIRSLALSLGLVATGARGQEVWRPAHGAPAVSLGKPRAIATSKPADAASSPAATMLRPVPIAASAKPDASVHQASFTPARGPVARGIAPEAARPMPAAPTSDSLPPVGMHTWQRSDSIVASTVSRVPDASAASAAPPPPRTPAEPLAVSPTPVPPVTGPAVTGPAVTGPGMVLTPGVPSLPGAGQPILVPTPTDGGLVPPPGVAGGPPMIANTGPCCPPACTPACGPTCCPPGGGGCGLGASLWGYGGCCDGPRLTVNAEFLMWWMSGDATPPLLTQGPPVPFTGDAGADRTAFANSLAANGTVIFGNRDLADNVRPGGRLSAVYWFGGGCCWGLDGSVFFLGNADDGRSTYFGNGLAFSLGRPFNSQTPGTDVGNLAFQEVAGPNLDGGMTITRHSNFWGADLNLRRNFLCGECLRVDFLAGGRYLGLDESLTMQEVLTVARGPGAGTTFSVFDRFSAVNRFYGGQVGFDGEYRYGALIFGMRGKVGLGVTEQQVNIQGNTVRNGVQLLNSEGQPAGLLANGSTNAGSLTRKFFGVVPEVGVTLGYDFFDWMRVTAGYNFLYWNNVARPGEQIDPRVNAAFAPDASGRFGVPANLVGSDPRLPARKWAGSDLFVHGITFGLEFRY